MNRVALGTASWPSRPILVNVRLALSLALALWALGGCGAEQGEDPPPHSEVTASDSAVKLVDKAEAELVLHVSNQSFDDEKVRLTVMIDAVTVVDGDFHVEDQHNWVSFPLALSSGRHEIMAESDSGATLRESFEVKRGKTRHAAIDHWGEDDSADLSWQSQWQAMGFG